MKETPLISEPSSDSGKQAHFNYQRLHTTNMINITHLPVFLSEFRDPCERQQLPLKVTQRSQVEEIQCCCRGNFVMVVKLGVKGMALKLKPLAFTGALEIINLCSRLIINNHTMYIIYNNYKHLREHELECGSLSLVIFQNSTSVTLHFHFEAV